MKLTHIFAGRREAALLTHPSVHCMTAILAQRCHNELWVRNAVASLARFLQQTGIPDLEDLRQQALADLTIATQSLTAFAHSLPHSTVSQIAALAIGPKLWFRLNGIPVPWRPLPGQPDVPAPVAHQAGIEPVILLSLASSGLHLTELLSLRVGDIGSLDANGRLLPDIEAEPLAVQYRSCHGKHAERLTFLSYPARHALLRWLASSRSNGQPLNPNVPLLAQSDGSPLSRASLARTRQRGRAVIQAGNNANVELCRATGDFFRRWGMPGSRFTGPEDLNWEDVFS